jgi:hypothetical protein
MPHAGPIRCAECARKARKSYYRRYCDKGVDRAARYRQANRKAVAQRQRSYSQRKLAENPVEAKDAVADKLGGRLRKVSVCHGKGFLELLAMPWPEFAARLE